MCRYMLIFTMFSVFGWIHETIYCTIKHREWSNRGFLFGPVCPIYGAGTVAIVALVEYVFPQGDAALPWWAIFLISQAGSAVLEYTTHFTLEKCFHAYWWDYSSVPLNIKGRVSLPTSLAFGAAGVLITFVLAPWATGLIDPVPHYLVELLALFFTGIFCVDLGLTIAALTDMETRLLDMEANLDLHMEQFVLNVEGERQNLSEQLAAEREKFAQKTMLELLSDVRSAPRYTMMRIKGIKLRTHGTTVNTRMQSIKNAAKSKANEAREAAKEAKEKAKASLPSRK